MTEGSQLIRGLEGVVAAETRCATWTAGTAGWPTAATTSTSWRGRPPSRRSAYLLWHDELPRPPSSTA